MKISKNKMPDPHPFYGDKYERGQDPFHEDAFPEELKDQAPNRGKRKWGWFLLDHSNNQIGFYPDSE